MNPEDQALRKRHPLTWLFHRNTSRWIFNTLTPHSDDMPEPGREDSTAELLCLPPASLPAMSLGSAIHSRRSCRSFQDAAIPLGQVATLLFAAYGVKGRSQVGAVELMDRTIPSGGGMYALECYAVVNRAMGFSAGIYHYVPTIHGLETVRHSTAPGTLLRYLFMSQPYAAEAAMIIVMTAAFQRALKKYGDRGYRYLLMEAGHAAQNVNLVATGLSLGSCNLGGFFDVELGALLRLDIEREQPLYAVALGKPAQAGP